MRVLVVDDSLIVRQGLSHMLEAAGVSVVGQLDGPATLMSRVKMDRPDVVLLDIRMPPTHTTAGILAAEQLRSVYPELAVLVLSQFVEPSYALRLLHDHPEGMGYLLKDRIHDPAVLIDALRRLTESETVVDPTISRDGSAGSGSRIRSKCCRCASVRFSRWSPRVWRTGRSQIDSASLTGR
jgi:DNA-binding NarL/FixJ family response regulator